jgi:hypothetical protein
MLQNPAIAAHFETLGAHSDVSSEVLAALKKLGEHEVRHGASDYPALYVVTRNIVFCGASGMSSTYWRLMPADIDIAVRTGADRTELGPEWVEFRLYQAGWPKLDLAHWALRAYDFARTAE